MRVFYAPPACDFRHTNKPPSVRRRFDKYSELARLRLLLRAGVVSVDDCYKPSLVRPFNVRVILLRRRGVVATIMDRAFGRPASKNSFRRIRPSVLATPPPIPPIFPDPPVISAREDTPYITYRGHGEAHGLLCYLLFRTARTP